MKTVNINGKNYTKKEFLNVLRVTDESGLFETFATLQIEPPTLRPMSEPLKGNGSADFILLERGQKKWMHGYFRDDNGTVEHAHSARLYTKESNYTDARGSKLLGYLPAYELPNPNEIKLPC